MLANGRGKIRASITWIVCAADGDILRQLVLDVDIDVVRADGAEGLDTWVGEVELAVVTVKTADGLAGSTLKRRPLELHVALGAGVGAEGILDAAVALVALRLGHTHNVVVAGRGLDVWLLDAGPSAKVQPIDGDGAVVGWEGGAIELAVWELFVDTSAGAARVGVGVGLDDGWCYCGRLLYGGCGLRGR